MLSLPNARELENRDFDSGDLVKRVTETPIDGPNGTKSYS
jgi:hypothetical protein